MSVLGILGAGKLGTVIARLGVAAGYDVRIAASGDPAAITMTVDVLSPGATPAWAVDVAQAADTVVLTVPLSRLHTVPAADLAGKIVVDATNYWPPTDGILPNFIGVASSPIVAAALPGARVVKSLSHIGYHELDRDARPSGATDRHAVAVAGDGPEAVDAVASLVDRLGFDPLVLPGGLRAGAAFGPGTRAFGESVDRTTLTHLLSTTHVA